MATVGSIPLGRGHITVHADRDPFERELRAFGNSRAADIAGDQAGKRFGDRFAKAWMGVASRAPVMGPVKALSEREGIVTGRLFGDKFVSGWLQAAQRVPLRGVFEPIVTRGGDAAGGLFGQRFNQAWLNVARQSPVLGPMSALSERAGDESGRRFGHGFHSAATRAIGDRKIHVPIEVDAQRLQTASTAITRALRIPAIATGAALAAGAITSIAASLFAVASAAAPAVGALAVIPSAALAAAQGVGVLAAAFFGVGDALKAMTAADKQGGNDARIAATARRAAAESVRHAQDTLADTYRNVSDVARQGLDRVADAERSLIGAQRDARAAQVALTQARKDAQERLEDLALSLKGAALDEQDAVLGLERARQRLAAFRGDRSSLEYRELALAARQAALRVEEVRERNADLRREAATARRAGVEGDAQVVAARQRVSDANAGVAQAQRDLTRAVQDSARANTDAARAVTRAQQNLAAAQASAASATDKQTGSQRNLAFAMQQLSPAGRRFVTFLHNEFLPALRDIGHVAQNEFLPPLQAAMRRLLVLTPLVSAAVRDTARAMGELATRGAAMVTSGPWRRDFATVAAGNVRLIETFGDAALRLAPALRDITVAALPLTQRFAEFTVRAADAISKFVAARRESGGLAAFFKLAGDAAAQLGRIIGNVARAVVNVGLAAIGPGQQLLDWVEQSTVKFREFTASAEGQNKLRKYFQDAVTPAQEMARLLGAFGGALARIGASPGLAALIRQVRTQLLPAVESMIMSLTNTGAAAGFVTLLTNMSRIVEKLATGGALDAFIDTLNALASGFLRLLRIPVIGQIAQWGLVLGGTAAALGVVAGRISPLVGSLAILARRTGFTTVAGLALRGAMAGVAAVIGAISLPVAIAIGAVVALGIGLVVAYRRSEAFRNIVNGVFRAVGAAGKFLWERVLRPAFNGLVTFFQRIVAPTVLWFWRNIWVPAFKAMGVVLQIWRAVFQGIFVLAAIGFKVLAGVVGWFWRHVWWPIWNSISGHVGTVWRKFIRPIFDAVGGYIKRDVAPAFGAGVKAIGKAWDALKEVAKVPVKFVINTVINGLIGGINRLAELVFGRNKGPRINKISLPKGFHTGGRVDGYGTGDKELILAEPDETIINRRRSRELDRRFGRDWIDRVNKGTAKFGIDPPKFQAGGRVYPVGRAPITQGYKAGHPAIDWGVRTGTPVRSAEDGRVYLIRSLTGSYGRYMKVSHPSGYNTLYAHLSRFRVPLNAAVQSGQQIANSGSTGNSTGPHLHFEVTTGRGAHLNPLNWLSGARVGGALSSRAPINLAAALAKLGEWITAPGRWLAARFAGPLRRLREITGTPLGRIVGQLGHTAAGWLRNRASGIWKAITGKAASIVASVRSSVASALGLSAPKSVSGNVALGKSLAAVRGWTGSQWTALYNLWQRESGWRSNAQNPTSTAYGIAQFLNSTWASTGYRKSADPRIQILAGLRYIAQRYTNPVFAYRAWQSRSPHWYGRGGLIDEPVTGIGGRSGDVYHLGERGPEWVVPAGGTGGVSGVGGRGGVTVNVYINTLAADLDQAAMKIRGALVDLQNNRGVRLGFKVAT
jgi:hypothetical protein